MLFWERRMRGVEGVGEGPGEVYRRVKSRKKLSGWVVVGLNMWVWNGEFGGRNFLLLIIPFRILFHSS